MEGLVFSWCALNFLANQALVRLRAAEFSICRLSGITSMHERYYKHNVVLSVCDCWGIIGSTVQTFRCDITAEPAPLCLQGRFDRIHVGATCPSRRLAALTKLLGPEVYYTCHAILQLHASIPMP